MGHKDAGLLLSVWVKAGGYYMGMNSKDNTNNNSKIHGHNRFYYYTDVGGSQYIIDGKIKLKNDSQIQGFTTNGLKFEDGSEVETDVVVFCTGFVKISFLEFDD